MEDDWIPPTEGELKVIEARRERNEKISSVMGGYLLRGYKMLGETCDVCFMVLLESRQGVKFCVACQEVDVHETAKDDPIMNEQAARRLCQEHSTPTAEFHSETTPQADTAQSSVSVQPEASTQQTGGASTNDSLGRQISNRPTDHDTALPVRFRRTCASSGTSVTGASEEGGHVATPGDMARLTGIPSPTSSSATCSRDHGQSTLSRLSGTADSLTAKILWATKELETEMRDLTRCRLLAQVIRDCSEALATVNKVQWPGGGDC
ncbi:Sjoegren syndrome/scleroderma autoantigen 1-like [Tropilaelaps mercedesae]|uniref:Sjoegren syndrome/scleroderma autoantigen 1-like n=1 Tax=Tropilaelaps mercedesae TaxID=418985 RepID=A0A1V9XCU1_9ACAR|nr:Sjoegren syndrome/scleroderma autoantigen 1-like [Tropilaelaps mercedesae]